eukprot:gb/GFBE01048603.1/.p1 GENE.gb/GFBE01048603.1/~~gb/GFBE01048603.1/.p1  ORF type:complete len:395 (+),score=79.93 gb/GFBE01048603.1/:1-1185(+)
MEAGRGEDEADQGPVFYVKNTFLDLDDGPRKPVLARWKSMPAKFEDDDDDDEDEEEDDGVQAPPAGEDTVAPPEMPELYRTVTVDGYEPSTEWNWVQSGGGPSDMSACQAQMPMAPAASTGGYGAPAGATMVAVPMQFPPQAVGMVMPPGAVLMGPIPGPGMLPGGAVPVQRFDRWPEGIPAPPSAPAPTPDKPADEPRSPAPTTEPSELPPVVLPAVAKAEVPKPPVLQRAFSVTSAIFRIRWTVDARVLKSTDREKVSPPFELSVGGVTVEFKMVLRPIVSSDGRGGQSFKKAKGKGTVDLRCIHDVDPASSCPMTFRVAVGRGSSSAPPKEGGAEGAADAAPVHRVSEPMRHDFAQKAICSLAAEDKWDFNAAVDEESQTFVVSLEVMASR